MPNTQEYIDRVCKYRGLPEIKMGTPCEVEGKKGAIVGGNVSEANDLSALLGAGGDKW